MNNRISTYVSDNFSDEQKSVFNFLVSTFPEKLRMINTGSELVEIESVYAVLALIANMVGESRELIGNIQYIRDVDYLRQNSSDDTVLEKSNAKARLLNALDLNAALLDEDLTVERQLEIIDENPEFFLNSPDYISNRGTMATLQNVIEDFLLVKLPAPAKEADKVQAVNNPAAYDFTVDPDGVNGAQLIQIETLIDDVIDPSANYIGDYYEIKRDSDLYKVINAVRPAGIIYTIIMLYRLNLIENLTESFMSSVHSDNASILSNEILATAPTVVLDSIVSHVGLTAPLVYEVTITNPYDHMPVLCRVRDFTDTTYSVELTHKEFLLGPGEQLTKQFQSFNNYDYDTPIYIAAHLRIGSKDSPYDSADTVTGTEPLPVVLADPEFTATSIRTMPYGGGSTTTIYNSNNLAVTANISITWKIGSYTAATDSAVRSISGRDSVVFIIANPQTDVADCIIDVYFTATGYDATDPAISTTIYDVPRLDSRLQ